MNTLTEAREGIVALLEARVKDFDNNAAFEPKPVAVLREVTFPDDLGGVELRQNVERGYLKQKNDELRMELERVKAERDMTLDNLVATHQQAMRMNAQINELQASLDSAKKQLQLGQDKLKEALATQLTPKPKECVISEHPGELAGIKGLVRLSVIPFEETKSEPKTVILGLHAGRPFEEIASDPDVPIEEKIAAHKMSVSKTFTYEFIRNYVKGA